MTFNSKRFKEQLGRNKLTQRRWAKALGIDPSSVTHILGGKRKLKLDDAVETARLFHVPLDEVLTAAGLKMGGLPASKDQIPVAGWIDGEFKVHPVVEGALKGSKMAPSCPYGGRSVRVLRYQTSGTVLEALDGGLVYFAQKDTAGAIGRLSVCELDRGEVKVGVVKRGYEPGTHTLVDLAGRAIADAENVVLKSAAPVIWIKL